MNEYHPLYQTILERIIDLDRRDFLPPRKERIGDWMAHGSARPMSVDLSHTRLPTMDLDAEAEE